MQKLMQINVQAATPDYPFYPESSGDWAEDNRRGREAAKQLADYVKTSGDMPMVGRALAQIYSDNSPRTSGVRAGFTYGIAGMISQ